MNIKKVAQHTLKDTHQNQSGISLMELLITTAIVGIVTALTIALVPGLFAQSRNNARIADVRLLRDKMDIFLINAKKVPDLADFQSGVVNKVRWEHYHGHSDNPTAVDLATGASGNAAAVAPKDKALKAVSSGATATVGKHLIGYARHEVLGPDSADGDVSKITLPGQNVIHVWVGYVCDPKGFLTKGNNVVASSYLASPTTTDVGSQRYGAGSGTWHDGTGTVEHHADISRRAIAYVYQLEGESKAYCEDTNPRRAP